MTTTESLQRCLSNASQVVPSITGGMIPPTQDILSPPPIPEIDDSRNAAYVEDVETIYRNSSPLLNGAIRLLSEAIDDCTSALEAENRQDRLAADDSMQRVQANLPSLFERRGLGDGYGTIINAIRFAFINKEGAPFSRPQIQSIVRMLKQVRSHPYIGIENAVEATEILENTGLCVDPVVLGAFLREAEEGGVLDGD